MNEFYVVWRVIGDGQQYVEREDPLSFWPTLEQAETAREQARGYGPTFVSGETWGRLKGWDNRVRA